MEIDHHIGAAMSGLVADGITLIDNARVNAANHFFNYGEPISVVCFVQTESVAQSLSEIMLSFGEDDNTKMVLFLDFVYHSLDHSAWLF